MKFYLHWLRYDLRRFRLPLALWVLMVTAYAAFLGWLHLNIPTVTPQQLGLSRTFWTPLVTPQMLGLSRTFSTLLFCTDISLIPLIFASDPAAGVQPFWKTRPPSGFAVAGVKVTLVLSFFLCFPVLAFLIMQALCVQPGYSEGGLSLLKGFLWGQSVLISVCALGVAGAGAGRSTLIKGAQVAIVCFAVLILAKANSLFPTWSPGWLRLPEYLLRGFLWNSTAAVALILSCCLFIGGRRQRVPFKCAGLVIFLLPPAVIIACSALLAPPALPAPRDESIPRLAPAVAEKIRIPVHDLENPHPRRIGGDWTTGYIPEPIGLYQVVLPIEGLPPDCIAAGRWLDLKLRSADGQELSMDLQASLKRADETTRGDNDDSAWIAGCEMAFPLWELAPLTEKPCSASGILRLTVLAAQETRLDMRNPEIVENPLGRFRFSPAPALMPADPPRPESVPDGRGWAWSIPELFSIERQPAPFLEYSLLHLPSGNRLPLPHSVSRENRGYFMAYVQESRLLTLPAPGRDARAAKENPPPLQHTAPEDWRMAIHWYQPMGTMDIPLTFPRFDLPTVSPEELHRSRQKSAKAAASRPARTKIP